MTSHSLPRHPTWLSLLSGRPRSWVGRDWWLPQLERGQRPLTEPLPRALSNLWPHILIFNLRRLHKDAVGDEMFNEVSCSYMLKLQWFNQFFHDIENTNDSSLLCEIIKLRYGIMFGISSIVRLTFTVGTIVHHRRKNCWLRSWCLLLRKFVFFLMFQYSENMYLPNKIILFLERADIVWSLNC